MKNLGVNDDRANLTATIYNNRGLRERNSMQATFYSYTSSGSLWDKKTVTLNTTLNPGDVWEVKVDIDVLDWDLGSPTFRIVLEDSTDTNLDEMTIT